MCKEQKNLSYFKYVYTVSTGENIYSCVELYISGEWI